MAADSVKSNSLAPLVLCAVVGSVAVGAIAQDRQEVKPALRLSEIDAACTEAFARISPALVAVVAEQEFAGAGLQRRTRRVSLSGTVWDDDGAIVSFGRDLAAATSIHILTAGRDDRVEARLIGVDPETDVALLEASVDGRAKPLERAARPPRLGGLVLTLGNPFGLRGSASLANVSGLGRAMNLGSVAFQDALQITAPVNPGDPGGVVANARGELVGIMASSLRARPSLSFGEMRRGRDPEGGRGLVEELRQRLDRSGAQGLSFVLPNATIASAIARIRVAAKQPRVWLGVEVIPVPEDLARELEIEPGRGALVTGVVVDSPARKAGVVAGDVILGWNGAAVVDLYQLRARVTESKAGDKVQVRIVRQGRELELVIELGSQFP
jgi:serine protease Do